MIVSLPCNRPAISGFGGTAVARCASFAFEEIVEVYCIGHAVGPRVFSQRCLF